MEPRKTAWFTLAVVIWLASASQAALTIALPFGPTTLVTAAAALAFALVAVEAIRTGRSR